MALERRSPLPVGIYWIDAFGDNRARLAEWLSSHRSTVKVRKSTAYQEPPGDWALFEVLAPTPWNTPSSLGYPTIAERGKETTPEDTVKRPAPEDDPLWSSPFKGGLGVNLGKAALGLGLGLGAAYYFFGRK